MNSFSNDDEDDQFFSKLALDEITALEMSVVRTVDKSTSANTTATIATGGFDGEDDEVFFIGDYVKKPVDDKTAVASKVNVTPAVAGPSSSFYHAPLKDEKVKARVSRPAGRCEDDNWLEFQSWFEKQQCFKTPWFRSIHITRLNVSQCKSIIACCKTTSNLVQFANILMLFLKETNDTIDFDHLKDTATHLIELLLLRIEKDFQNESCSFSAIFEDILDFYLQDQRVFGTLCIPELLVRLHPKSFSDILGEAVKTGNVELVIPVCSKNPTVFQKIMQCLYSGDGYSKPEIPEDDPDFQNYTISTQKFATDLVQLLKQALGSAAYLNLFPVKLHAIFSFDSFVCKHEDLIADNMIINEMCCLLNDLLCECAVESSKSKNFLIFLVSLLPFTSKLLNDKKLMKSVKFKDFPYLWIKVRNSSHFG